MDCKYRGGNKSCLCSGMLISRHAPDHRDHAILRHFSRANGAWNRTYATATYRVMESGINSRGKGNLLSFSSYSFENWPGDKFAWTQKRVTVNRDILEKRITRGRKQLFPKYCDVL